MSLPSIFLLVDVCRLAAAILIGGLELGPLPSDRHSARCSSHHRREKFPRRTGNTSPLPMHRDTTHILYISQ